MLIPFAELSRDSRSVVIGRVGQPHATATATITFALTLLDYACR